MTQGAQEEATAVLQARSDGPWTGAAGVAVGWAQVAAMVMGWWEAQERKEVLRRSPAEIKLTRGRGRWMGFR